MAEITEKCRKCKGELTRLEKSGCLRCLKCDPIVEVVPVVKENKNTKVDVRITEDDVRRIVREELEDWVVPTRGTVGTYTVDPAIDTSTVEIHGEAILADRTWREEAKELGVPLTQPQGGSRKKKDVLADIAAKKNDPTGQ